MAELEKAVLLPEGDGDAISFMFNPETVSVSQKNSWEENQRPGRGVGTLKFKGSSAGTMSLTAIFDTTDTGDSVMTHTSALMDLLKPDTTITGSDPKSGNVRPKYVTFLWGEIASWPAMITGLDVKFTYFASTGKPLRAEVTLSLQQYEAHNEAFKPQNPTSGTPDPHRTHRVQPGETLDRIAARYYGDSNEWRTLAAANGVEDPLTLRAGALISVPRLGAG